MKPKTEKDKDRAYISEIPIRMLFHPPEVKILDCWDIKADEPTITEIETLNPRSSCHSLNIIRISKDIEIYDKAGKLIRIHGSLRTVLDGIYGLKLSDRQLRKSLLNAHKKYGSGIWLRACPYSLSVHGLCKPEDDYLLIQSGAEANMKPDGMFIIKHKLLNQFFELEGSNKRFVKSYVRHKII